MKTVAFVPIKMNNERLPGKNIKPFSDGMTILEMILQKIKSVKNVAEIYVFCSDESILYSLLNGLIAFNNMEQFSKIIIATLKDNKISIKVNPV